MKNHQRHLLTAGIVIGALAIGIGGFVWSGLYDIGADDPHWTPTRMLIDKLRERSIATRMADVASPDLEDPQRIRLGAANYSAMCTGCHLSPGAEETEIRPGLYPMPPDLATLDRGDPKRSFWIIKHGIKMTAMPAWGKTHTDEQIWNMVAFLQKLPGMTPAQYAALGGKPPAEDEDHMHAPQSHAGAARAKDPPGALPAAAAQGPWPVMVVTKNASCGCCGAWIERMRAAGFRVEVHDVDNLDPVKTRLGIPAGKGSCHTAEIGGYFVEGHVPAQDIKRLLAERPDARGLVLPGMPPGSPGMEVPDGTVQPYTVELVDRQGETVAFARH